MPELGAFVLSIVTSLVANAVQGSVNYATQGYFQRRKIERSIEDAVANVVEPLLPFLSQEGVKEKQQELLFQICVDELYPLAQEPDQLFQGSLNGQKIFDQLYAERNYPQAVLDEGLKEIYILLFPRIATLLCKLPAAVKDWEYHAWAEGYRRLDEVAEELRGLFDRVDALTSAPSDEADVLLRKLRRTLAQKIGIELDLTGLRSHIVTHNSDSA